MLIDFYKCPLLHSAYVSLFMSGGIITKIIVIGIISHLKKTIAMDKPLKIPPTAQYCHVRGSENELFLSTHAHLGEEANVKIYPLVI